MAPIGQNFSTLKQPANQFFHVRCLFPCILGRWIHFLRQKIFSSNDFQDGGQNIIVHTIDTKDDEEPEGTRRARGSNHRTLDLYEDSRVQRFNQPGYHDPTNMTSCCLISWVYYVCMWTHSKIPNLISMQNIITTSNLIFDIVLFYLFCCPCNWGFR